jgi:hypothetical protein
MNLTTLLSSVFAMGWLGADPAMAEVAEPPGPPQAEAGPPPPAAQPDPTDELAEIALLLRVGASVTGIARDSVSCDGNDCPAAASGSDGFTQGTALLLGAGFLWQIHPLLRLGPGLSYTNNTELSYKDAPSQSSPIQAGSLLSMDIMAELSPHLSRKVWLLSGAKLGLSVLYPAGGFERYLQRLADDCRAVGTMTGCDSLEGARLGPNFGVSLGGLFSINEIVRLRANALLEAFTVPLAHIEAVDADASVDEDLYGARFMLLGGVELGLQGRR